MGSLPQMSASRKCCSGNHVCESIFVVELMLIGKEFRDILDTVVRGGILVKIGTNGLLCLWLSCCGMHSDKVEWQLYCRGGDTLCEVLQGGDSVFVSDGINIWNLT